MPTTIEWADETWNVFRGCSKISDGCTNCYAERIDLRFNKNAKPWVKRNIMNNLNFFEKRLEEPFCWRKPRLCFVNSMSDMFHEDVPNEWIQRCFEVMRDWKIIEAGHIFQILTKRPDELRRIKDTWWTENIWQGVSIENRKTLHRMDKLRECPAKTKFVSLEPLLEDLGELDFTDIDWAIIGGESGPHHRPMDHAWARSIRDQCLEQNVEFFFKQSAAFQPGQGNQLIEADGSRNIWNYYPIEGRKRNEHREINKY